MYQIVEVSVNGEVIRRYFQCHSGDEPMDERWARVSAEMQMAESENELVREETRLHDPNFWPRVRHKNVVQFGNRINRVREGSSYARHQIR